MRTRGREDEKEAMSIQTWLNQAERLRELTEHIIKYIVNNPDNVEVREKEGQGTVVLEVSVAKEDIAPVGKLGNG